MINVNVPIRTKSEANLREHWAAKAKRVKLQRSLARNIVMSKIFQLKKSQQYRITLTRTGPRRLDSDNLAGSFKAIRDGIADALEVDDGSTFLCWEYKQEKGRDFSVTITIVEY